MKSVPELQALFDLTHPDADTVTVRTVLDRIEAGDLDYTRMIFLARRHRVISIISRKLLDIGATGDQFAAFSRRLGRQTRSRRMLIAAQAELIRALQDADVPVLVLKGSAVSSRLYETDTDRQFKDIDLLVPPDRFAATETILRQLGYQMNFPFRRLTPSRQSALLRMACDASFLRTADAVQVELHWRTDRSRAFLDLSAPDPSRAAQTLTTPQSIPVLPLPEQILYLTAHGAKHSWFRLYWLMDMAQAVSKLAAEDWDAVTRLAHQHGHTKTLATALQLVWQVYQIDLPKPLLQFVADHHDAALTRFCWQSLCGTDGRTHIRWRDLIFLLRSFLYRMRLKAGLRYKLAVLAQSLIEPRDIGWLGLPAQTLPIYILIAPISAIARLLSRG